MPFSFRPGGSRTASQGPREYKTLPRIARQQLQKMARNRPFYPSFPCFLVPSPNQKRFFSVFKVSLNIMRQSDLASADVEFRKSDKKLHLSGAPDCQVEQPAVWSFFLWSIVHSSLIILILLFDRILGLPLALQAEYPRTTSSIPTSVRVIKVADGSRFIWLLTG